MKTTIDDLLADADDFRLCDGVFLRLDAAAEALVLTCGAERVEVHTWSRAELDGRTRSFLASVFSAAGVVLDDDP